MIEFAIILFSMSICLFIGLVIIAVIAELI